MGGMAPNRVDGHNHGTPSEGGDDIQPRSVDTQEFLGAPEFDNFVDIPDEFQRSNAVVKITGDGAPQEGLYQFDKVDGGFVQLAQVGAVETQTENAASKINRSSDQTLDASAFTEVAWDSNRFDDVGAADLPNNRYVIPADGTYFVNAHCTIGGLGDQVQLQLEVTLNGSTPISQHGMHTGASGRYKLDGTLTDQFNENDVLTVEIFQGDTGGRSLLSGREESYFDLARLA